MLAVLVTVKASWTTVLLTLTKIKWVHQRTIRCTCRPSLRKWLLRSTASQPALSRPMRQAAQYLLASRSIMKVSWMVVPARSSQLASMIPFTERRLVRSKPAVRTSCTVAALYLIVVTTFRVSLVLSVNYQRSSLWLQLSWRNKPCQVRATPPISMLSTMGRSSTQLQRQR